jgi:hypothetical protein
MMIQLPLTLRHALRLGAHPAPLRLVRSRLEVNAGYDPDVDGPRIDRGRLVVAEHLAEPVARALDELGMVALADALHVEAVALRDRAARSA